MSRGSLPNFHSVSISFLIEPPVCGQCSCGCDDLSISLHISHSVSFPLGLMSLISILFLSNSLQYPLLPGMIFLLLLAIATSSWHLVTADCPEKCTCEGLVVDCSSAGLTGIPNGLPADVRSLVLRNNRINTLKKADLEGFSQLESLVLTHNKIRIVEENILDHLPELKRLSLAHNELVYIPPLTSASHPLASLNLKRNQIQFIDEQVGNIN